MNDGQQVPRSVYRRRRIAALVAGLVAVALMVAGVLYVVEHVGAWFRTTLGGTAAPPSPTPSDAPSTAPAGIPDCAPPTLAVTITADQQDVATGTPATFTVTITNGGNVECVVDAGDLSREVVIVSGSDRIWSSKDCAPADAPDRVLLLAAGAADETKLVWNQARSAEGCPGGLPAPQPGTYQATVTLAGASSGPAVFRLT